MATYDCDDVPSDEVPGDDVPDECPVDLPQANLEEVASEQDVERLLNLYTLILRQMQPTGTDIIRGIPAFRVVQKGPRRWMKGELQKLYSFSEVTSELDEFWSHSWRTKVWVKYASILLLANGLPAFLVGTLAALVAGGLSAARYVWCTPAGTLAYYLTLLLWRRKKKVFLDIACINQEDGGLKAEGLISMGAFLKRSKSFLVLWDSTYVSRLWCMFEMAAFLRSHELDKGAEESLVVCPVFVGPALLIGHLGLCTLFMLYLFSPVPQIPWGVLFICGLAFPCLTLFTFAMIAHCRSIDIIQKQVQNFSIDNSWSQCCACGHVVPDSGEQMICDRTIILRCIAAWFGSTEGFESTVRGKVQTVLVHQLTHRVFSYWRIVQVTSPALWAFLDFWNTQGHGFLEYALSAANLCFLFLPCIYLLLLTMAYRVRNLCGWTCTQMLLAAGLVAVGVTSFVLFVMAGDCRNVASGKEGFFSGQRQEGHGDDYRVPFLHSLLL
ncbi:PRN1 [Symbiodinium pilosum]|uniref:PRN1 protein n=1 Tax=Symbiodinium pilosum TaxID=2952 RepID=A0A812XRA6_SYMPI|nr:PRN1 [Symbiodinium pilosum]